jgi:hypothetical protein
MTIFYATVGIDLSNVLRFTALTKTGRPVLVKP